MELAKLVLDLVLLCLLLDHFKVLGLVLGNFGIEVVAHAINAAVGSAAIHFRKQVISQSGGKRHLVTVRIAVSATAQPYLVLQEGDVYERI